MNSEDNDQQEENDEGQLNLFPGFLAFSAGKDELNFAEFPIAALSNRINPEIKTITYEDEIKDSRTGKLVERKLQITGSDLYGLPTSVDDEVILALINLSRMQNFKNRTISFSRHQIISMLGWKNAAHYYKRIKESINRWLGVSLYYDNAWRDKDKESWGSEAFHLIDNIEWGENGEQSQITWNKRIFDSFESGNLKALDLQTYRDLKSPTARRIYRFLDKRFGLGQSKWSFDLQKFAFNKIGMSKASYKDLSQVKRQLFKAITQLEEVKFIMPVSKDVRFTKISSGVWKVHFERYRFQTQAPLTLNVSDETEIESHLVTRGVGRTAAQKLISEFGEKRIAERLEWLDYKEQQRQTGGIKSITGYLVNSIKDDAFSKPDGFVSEAEKEAQKALRAERAALKQKQKEDAENDEKARQKAEQDETERLLLHFHSLPPEIQSDIRDFVTEDFNMGEIMTNMSIASEVAKRIERGELKA